MAGSNDYPKMLYRSDDVGDGAQPVFAKEGVFYKVFKDAKAEAEAKKAGYRNSVYPKK